MRPRWSHRPYRGCARPRVSQVPGVPGTSEYYKHVGGQMPHLQRFSSQREMGTSTGEGWKWEKRGWNLRGEKKRIHTHTTDHASFSISNTGSHLQTRVHSHKLLLSSCSQTSVTLRESGAVTAVPHLTGENPSLIEKHIQEVK